MIGEASGSFPTWTVIYTSILCLDYGAPTARLRIPRPSRLEERPACGPIAAEVRYKALQITAAPNTDTGSRVDYISTSCHRFKQLL